MKKTLLTTALAAALSFSGLAAAAEKLVVAATPVPHAEILELIKPTLAKEGWTCRSRSLPTTYSRTCR